MKQTNRDVSCDCGTTAETAEHYLLVCFRFKSIRDVIIHTLLHDKINITTLLYGKLNLHVSTNETIIVTVHELSAQTVSARDKPHPGCLSPPTPPPPELPPPIWISAIALYYRSTTNVSYTSGLAILTVLQLY